MVWQNGCYFILGLLFLGVGISVKLGGFRSHYWIQPIGYYRTIIYGFPPLGIASMLVGVGPLFYETIWIIPLRILLVFFGLLGIFMWLFEPRFAKPDWINWLEDNHSDILPELRQELWHMGSERKEIIQNQAALEIWITEFRRRHIE